MSLISFTFIGIEIHLLAPPSFSLFNYSFFCVVTTPITIGSIVSSLITGMELRAISFLALYTNTTFTLEKKQKSQLDMIIKHINIFHGNEMVLYKLKSYTKKN